MMNPSVIVLALSSLLSYTAASSQHEQLVAEVTREYTLLRNSPVNNNNNNRSLLRRLQIPSCPNQEACHDFGNGYLGYSVSKVEASGSCHEVCAAGGSLTYYQQTNGYSCGSCPIPSCPNQESCHDFGNGYLGYSIHTIDENGECSGLCSAGNSLSTKLASGDWTCGECPKPSCPNQEPCYDYGGGWLAYAVHADLGNGSCNRVCAAGSSLTAYLNNGFTCGECPTPQPPTVAPPTPQPPTVAPPTPQPPTVAPPTPQPPTVAPPTPQPPTVAPPTPQPPTVAPPTPQPPTAQPPTQPPPTPQPPTQSPPTPQPPTQQPPTCPNQTPCDQGVDYVSYNVYKTEGTTCTEYCAHGTFLAARMTEGYTCGTCPNPQENQPTCPDQQPCKEEDGWVYQSLYKLNDANTVCTEVCAAGYHITDKQNEGFVCGSCPEVEEQVEEEQPSCPNQDPCDEQNGWVYYSLYKVEGNSCTEACAAGHHITDKQNEGFVCGECAEIEQPSCPNQEPCHVAGDWTFYSLYKMNDEGTTCTQTCATGFHITDKQEEGFVCGQCPDW